ncbi:MAG: putative baseplate assembly protein [Alphaproteobacteria bacterium]|nr:putative baseplate assembly protein [Alphaproteobacteria bacterium]
MSADAPRLDPRSEADLATQAETLASTWTAWRPAADGSLDLGGALIHTFARIAGHALDALNQAPDHNYSAFLRLMGVEALAPRAARVPLTFSLTDKAPTEATVPAGTQAATGADAEHATESLFTTEADLVVVRSAVAQVASHQPSIDKLNWRNNAANGATDEVWPALEADGSPLRRLSLGCDSLVRRADLVELVVRMATDGSGIPMNAVPWDDRDHVSWFVRGDGNAVWKRPTFTLDATELTATLDGPLPGEPMTWYGATAQWIFLNLRSALPEGRDIPTLSEVSLIATLRSTDTPIAAAFTDSAPLDLSGDVLPFGERPRYNQAFTVSLPEDIATLAGALIQLTFSVSDTPPAGSISPSADLVLRWEIRTGAGWTTLGNARSGQRVDTTSAYGFTDGTDRLSQDGDVTFTLPPDVLATTLGTKTACWVRARIVAGDYGQDASVGVTDGAAYVVDATLAPPALAAIAFSYEGTVTGTPDSADHPLTVHTYNNGNAEVAALPVQPWVPTPEQERALYLAFDPTLPRKPVSLYVQVQAAEPASEDPDGVDGTRAPELRWEILTADGWTRLNVEDGTAHLTQPGMVRFLPPADGFRGQVLGRWGQWIRAIVVEDGWISPPRVGRIALNTVWARDATPVDREIVGSGTGQPDQTLALARPPALDGEVLEVYDSAEGWLRWTRVADFGASGPTDPHYQLDHSTGAIAFGDGQRGHPPPEGVDNVRVTYVSGGGADGNRAAGTVTVLKRALAYVGGVTNIDPAFGGRDAIPTEALLIRDNAPFRHRGRAVAPQDFEDIAALVSDTIARVAAIPPHFYSDNAVDFDPATADRGRGGWIRGVSGRSEASSLSGGGELEVVVVPWDTSAQPTPTQGLLAEVRTALQGRCDASFALLVRGPLWVEVQVTAELGAQDTATASDLLERAQAALAAFLHPLTGGLDGRGWPFGRRPRDSDIQGLLAALDGLSFVRHLAVSCDPPLPMPEFLGLTHDTVHGELSRRQAAGALVFSGAHSLTLAEES